MAACETCPLRRATLLLPFSRDELDFMIRFRDGETVPPAERTLFHAGDRRDDEAQAGGCRHGMSGSGLRGASPIGTHPGPFGIRLRHPAGLSAGRRGRLSARPPQATAPRADRA